MGSFTQKNGSLKTMVFKKGKAYCNETINDEKYLVRYSYKIVPK